MCPHFLVPAAWSSMCTPAAPASTIILVNFITAVKPGISTRTACQPRLLTSVTGISIRNDRSEVVDRFPQFLQLSLSLGQRSGASPALFSVVEKLCLEQLSDLVGNSVRRVVCYQSRAEIAYRIAYPQGPGQARATS